MNIAPEKPSDTLQLLRNAFEHFSGKRFPQAIELCKTAIKKDPDNSDSYNLLALSLKEQDKLPEAIEYQKKAVDLDPKNPGHLKNLELMCRRNRDYDSALEAIRKAIDLDPNNPIYYHCAALTLNDMDRLEDSIEYLNKSLEIDKKFTAAHVMLGNILQELGEYKRAKEHLDKAFSLTPEDPHVIYNRSIMLLRLGDYENGLRYHETRWLQGPTMALPDLVLNRPRWDGKEFADKSLLVVVEQGYGDNIQFCRYIPEIIKLGNDVSVLCTQPLIDLLKPLAPKAAWISVSDPTPQFDIYVMMMSLPLVLGSNIDNVPYYVPYITAEKSLTDRWNPEIKDSGRSKVGICWAGSTLNPTDSGRSIRPEQIEQLFRNQNIDFYILQKDRDMDSATEFAEKYENVYELGSKIRSFSDSAAILDQLDLIISVDTAIVHLAGAMGKNIWNLLLFNSTWRWMVEREDSPWYPTMRLFRQQSRNDWQPVLEKIGIELNKL